MYSSSPFVLLDFEDLRQADLYNDVVAGTKRIYEINDSLRQHIDKSSKNILEKEKDRMVNELLSDILTSQGMKANKLSQICLKLL